jgi:RimJ/RimL family protein N-acetyltransferase
MAIFSCGGLDLRLPKEGDLKEIRSLRNEFSTWSMLTDPTILTDLDEKKWLDGLSWSTGRMYLIACDEIHPFIGLVRMDEWDKQNRSIRIGADVAVRLRRQGYGHKIYETLKRYCFDYLNCHRIWLAVLESNKAAMALYKKVGFCVEGRYREAVFRHGEYLDYILMSVLEREYS